LHQGAQRLWKWPEIPAGLEEVAFQGIPAAKLNKKIAQINAILANLDDGKPVFYKDIGKEFLDPNGGLSGAIMPDYLHLSAQGYDIWGKAIKGDIEKLVQ
jgi:lysophospholipase L1-like esterase